MCSNNKAIKLYEKHRLVCSMFMNRLYHCMPIGPVPKHENGVKMNRKRECMRMMNNFFWLWKFYNWIFQNDTKPFWCILFFGSFYLQIIIHLNCERWAERKRRMTLLVALEKDEISELEKLFILSRSSLLLSVCVYVNDYKSNNSYFIVQLKNELDFLGICQPK